jgi:hypothetical protein
MAGIYLVKFRLGRRLAIVASGADEALRIAEDHVAKEVGIEPTSSPETRVGRLGDYDPGSEGLALVAEAGAVVAG